MLQLTKEQIEKMIELGETDSVEFKKSFSAGSKDILRAMAGLANNRGGYIFCGVNDENIIVGLKSDNAKLFCDMQHSTFPNKVTEIFSPEILWDSYYFPDINVGVIYVHESNNKPIIAVKPYEDNIKAPGIYYRYHNQTRLIEYSELTTLIETVKRKERDRENERWLRLLEKIKLYGIDNTGVLDSENGVVYGAERNFVIDEKLFNRIKKDLVFIKEGEFDEKEGTKTLKLIGNLNLSVSDTTIPSDTSPTAIIGKDIYLDFLLQKNDVNFVEYIKAICDGQGYFPMYYYMYKSGKNKQEIKQIIRNVQTTKKSQVTNILKAIDSQENSLAFITEPEGRLVELTSAQKKHKREKERLLRKGVFAYETEVEIKELLSAIRTLDIADIQKIKEPLLNKLLSLTLKYYATDSGPGLFDLLKKAVRYVDEVLYKHVWLAL